MGLLKQLLSPDFMPHGYCYLWDFRIVWLHVISDALIALSYYCIPVVLIYFIRKNREIPFNRIFWMFGTFILACGTTHLMEIWNVWHSSYLLAGVLKAITAVVSVVTAGMLIPLVPKVISLPSRMHLQEVNRKLEQDIAGRKRFDAPIDNPVRRRLNLGFVAAVLLTLLIGFSSWHGTRQAEQDAYWVSHTHDVIDTIQRTTRSVIEAGTSARAFALTGQEPLLLHYQTARQSIHQDEDDLRRLTADNLSQQRRLDVVVVQVGTAFEFAESIIAKRRKLQAYPGGSDALEIERLLDSVRATTQGMRDEEAALLEQRIQTVGTRQRRARILALAGTFLAVGLWLLARFAVNREIDVSERARAQVNTLNAELELRVEQRTAALQSEIAERERAEMASKTVLREMADQKFALDQHAIVAMTDVQGTITYVNDKFCAISQYSKDELIGQNHRILNSGFHPKEFFQVMYATIANGKVWHGEIKNRAKDGSIYWVDTTIVPFMSSEGKPRQYVAIRADITDRKRAEEDVADQKFALDQHAIVAITDVQGTITYVNDKFCAISQYSKDELIGRNHRILNSGHHPKEFFQQMYHVIASGKVWHGEIKNRAKDGSIYWVNTTIVPTVGAEGKPRQYVAIRADITERKQADEEIQNLNKGMESRNRKLESQAIELQRTRDELELRVNERTVELAGANQVLERSNIELQQFAYVASHDLQSPLRSISGFVQLLKSEYEGKLDKQADDWIRRTVQAIGQMQTMIRDVLAYSRVDSRSRPFAPTALLDVFNDAVALLESSIRDAGGQVDCGELPVVMGDRSQLVQLMQNLIGNGLKYHGDKTPNVHVSASRDGNEWIFSVRDNGIGIEPRYHDRVFEIFKRLHDQTEYPGSGIGLAVCRRVVTRHGGRIWLESEPEHGSVFHFTIPEGTDKIK
jgi:PAS domain S-box-containing protein